MPWQIAIIITLLVVLLIYSEPFRARQLDIPVNRPIVQFTQPYAPYESVFTPLDPYLMDNINRAMIPEDLKRALMAYGAARLTAYENRQSRQYGSAKVDYLAAATAVDNLQKKYGIFYIMF